MNGNYVVTAVLMVAFSLTSAAADGAWLEPRGNAQLTGVQALAGKMALQPQEIARLDLGRNQPSLTSVSLADGRILGIAVVAGAVLAYTQSGEEVWYQHPPGLNFTALNCAQDLDGDGLTDLLFTAGRPTEPYSAAVLLDAATGALRWQYDVEPMSYSWTLHTGSFVPGAVGQQIVVLMQGYPPDPKLGYIALFDFPAAGAPARQRWRFDFDLYTCFPTFLKTDLNADGVQDLVVQTHSRMWFFDAREGTVLQFLDWDVAPANIRSYGLTKFTDLDRDGREDFLCIANFAQHHEVLLNRDGKMVKAWHHGWDESVTTGTVATRYPTIPDVDFDGDKRTDLVLSMFNADGDQTWGARIYDALTGELKWRIPGVIVTACKDLDADGAVELLANRSSDPTGIHSQGAVLWKLCDGLPGSVWESQEGTALEGEALFVNLGGVKSQVLFDAAQGFHAAPDVPVSAPASPSFTALPSTVGNAIPMLLAAPLDSAPGCELLVISGTQIRTYALVESAFVQRGTYESDSPPAIADLDGDGALELVLATTAEPAGPTLTTRTPSLQDATLWQTTLPQTDRKGLPQPRRAYVRTLPRNDGATPNLYAWFGTPLVRSLGIEGRSGRVLWDMGKVDGLERYWGPSVNFASVWDYNADGQQDLIFTNPDYYAIADGTTGEFLLPPTFPPDIFKQPSQGLYTFPAVLPQVAQAPLVCLAGGHYFFGSMQIDAKGSWHRIPAPGENRSAAEAFAERAPGRWVVGFGRQNGHFSAVDAAEGTALAAVDLGATASEAISWDSNGDGKPEFVAGDSHGNLHRLGIAEDGTLDVVTTKLGRAGVGMPIPADFDGDGVCELAVPMTDGYILLLR